MKRIFLLILVCGGMFFMSMNSLASEWPEVTRENKPWTRWWWHGSAVDPKNLDYNLRKIADAGFGGVEVTAIYGVKGYEEKFIPYLSDEWVDILHYTATRAGELDMGLDMPPGSGWKCGGSFTPFEDANQSLNLQTVSVEGGNNWQADFESRYIQAVVARSNEGEQLDLTSQLQDNKIAWTAPDGDRWTVYVVESRWSGGKVKRAAPGGEGYSIDTYSKEAVSHFLRDFGDRVARLPEGLVRCYFHDSFEYNGNWSKEFLSEFKQRRGYDVLSFVQYLTGDQDSEESARVRSDVRRTLAEMLHDNMIVPLSDWAHAQGSLNRNQAHGSPGNLLDLYAACDIPETEIFGRLSGRDADPLINKFASSAAHVTGRKLTSSESYTWLDEHFTVTLETIKRATDQLFLAGINHIFYHGTAYSPKNETFPGWVFYASTQANPHNPWWRDLPVLNHYISRVQSFMQRGKPGTDFVIYWPYYDTIHNNGRLQQKLAVHSPDWFYDEPIGPLSSRLWNQGYQFDYISDLQLDECTVEQGRLGSEGHQYKAVLVPSCTMMPVATLQKLFTLAEQGGQVVFVRGLPKDVPGYDRYEMRREQLEKALEKLDFQSVRPGLSRAVMGNGSVWFTEHAADGLEQVRVERERMHDLSLYTLRRDMGDHKVLFVVNRGADLFDGWAPMSTNAEQVVLLDPMTDQSGLAQLRRLPDSRTQVRLQLEAGESVLLKIGGSVSTAHPWPYWDVMGSSAVLEGAWTVEAEKGGPDLPDSREISALESWTSWGEDWQSFSGTIRYTLEFDRPASADNRYLLDLGELKHSVEVGLNGRVLQTLIAPPYRLVIDDLKPKKNTLQLFVTNLAANRIRHMDRHEIEWRKFHDINFVNIEYRPFDASNWPVREAGLLGPVTLTPVQ